MTGAGGLNQALTVDYTDNIDAGTATASASYAGDTNHTASDDSENFTIDPADATVTVTGYSGTYDGAAHGATGSATGVGGVDLSAGLNLGASFTDYPGGTANWTFDGGTNYDDENGSAAIVINKAAVTATAGSYNAPVDAGVHALSACVVSGPYTGSLICTNNPTGPVGPGAGYGTVTPVIAPNGNFTITLVNGSWSITYAFTGFFQPVDNLPTRNSVKAGQAIPVKFSLNGNQGLAIFEAGYPKAQNLTCGSGASIDPIEETVTAGSSTLTYDASSGRYHYVWKTDKSWANSCRRLLLKFIDGTTQSADFAFTK